MGVVNGNCWDKSKDLCNSYRYFQQQHPSRTCLSQLKHPCLVSQEIYIYIFIYMQKSYTHVYIILHVDRCYMYVHVYRCYMYVYVKGYVYTCIYM